MLPLRSRSFVFTYARSRMWWPTDIFSMPCSVSRSDLRVSRTCSKNRLYAKCRPIAFLYVLQMNMYKIMREKKTTLKQMCEIDCVDYKFTYYCDTTTYQAFHKPVNTPFIRRAHDCSYPTRSLCRRWWSLEYFGLTWSCVWIRHHRRMGIAVAIVVISLLMHLWLQKMTVNLS